MAKLKRYYKVMDMGEDTFSRILIIKGPFKGLVYQYGKVRLEEDSVHDCARLQFEFEVFENPNGVTTKKPNPELKQLMGDILVELMEQNLILLQNEKDM